MSTLDMLSDNGGKPACFLDVGGGATTESVYEALTLISKLDRVKGILVNLYGGIVKTTVVAEAFLKAYEDNLIDLPVFSRLKGTESEKATEMLQGSRTKIFDTVEEAINAAVMGVKKLTDIFGLLKGNSGDSDYEKKGVIVQGITGAYGSLHAKI